MLGEGPLWHPDRQELFWFDIVGQQMLSRAADGAVHVWDFDEMHSAAGRIDRDRLLVASETALAVIDLRTGSRSPLCALEAGDRATRSNDGRADPQGGFWIGTMGKRAEPGRGAIWRWFRGTLRRLFGAIAIPNAICFAPDGRTAYFADTPRQRVWSVALDAEGWPRGEPEPFLDLAAEGLNPDGAVVDADGAIWVAQWGASRVAAYGPDGTFLRAVEVPAPHTSCPAFGGASLTTLFCTTALEGMDAAQRAAAPRAGMTFAVEGVALGRAEPAVRIES